MRVDWRRQILQLPSVGALSSAAVRAAYWRLKSSRAGVDLERIKQAKEQLLFELGSRLPNARAARLIERNES